MAISSTPSRLGTIYPAGSGTSALPASFLGVKSFLPDNDYSMSSGGQIAAQLSHMNLTVVFVKNGESTNPITPRTPVKWDTANVGLSVKIAGAGEEPCGVADPFMPSTGAASGDGFYIIIDGPATLISDGSGSISAGGLVVTAGTGKIKPRATSWAASTNLNSDLLAVVGRAMVDITNVDGTKGRVYVHPLLGIGT